MALRLLGSVAFWQAASFVMLLAFIWVNEALDLVHLIYDQPPTPIDWFGACILSAAVVLVGFVTVAHTYLRQCRALDSFLVVCAHCRKVRVGESAWTDLEAFVHGRTKTRFSHGICPACYLAALEDERAAPARHDCSAARKCPAPAKGDPKASIRSPALVP